MKINTVIVVVLVLAGNLLPWCIMAQSSRNAYNNSSRNTYSTPSRRVNNNAASLPSYSSSSSSTQRLDPGGNPDVPIDGGISLLLVAGAAFGAKKIHNSRKSTKTAEAKQP